MVTLILIISLFSLSLTAPPKPHFLIAVPETIKPYEGVWNATCDVESRFNPLAIGDKHLRNKSYGIAQIRQSRLDDYYLQTGIRYTTEDMFCPIKSKEVFMHYARGSDLEVIARCWNGGPNGMNKKSTIQYWKLIQTKLLKY